MANGNFGTGETDPGERKNRGGEDVKNQPNAQTESHRQDQGLFLEYCDHDFGCGSICFLNLYEFHLFEVFVMDGWLMRTDDGRRLSDIINGILFFSACSLFVLCGLMSWIAFQDEIKHGLRLAQGFLFG